MSFINATVHPDDLPKVEAVSLMPIERAFLKVLRLEWAITAGVLLLIAASLSFFIPGLKHTYGWMIIAATALLLILLHRFLIERSFHCHAYAVRERDVLLERGWIVRSIKACPFNRIQNCSVQNGPLERRFGLATLIVYTAGNDHADLKIPGLKQEEAERLRHFILGQIHTEAHEPA